MYGYDEVPYESHCYVLTHPARLGAMARLFGVAAAPAKGARVLELGCGQGWNCIASAYALPDAQHVGVDLGRVHIEDGRAAVEALGLRNVELLHGDFQTSPASGPFDYIIAHGLLSWVKPELADVLLARVHALLAPGGVFYVSYNCLPGWNTRRTARDAMRLRARNVVDAGDGTATVKAALDYLAFLANAAPPTEPIYRALLADQARELADMPVWYLRHDHLEDDNHPMYVGDVVARAGRAGLSYVADASLRAHPFFTLPPRVLGALAPFVDDALSLDEHSDFVTNNAFRRSLFVRSDTPRGAVFPRLDDADVAGLWVSSQAKRTGSPHDNIFVWGNARVERAEWPIARALDVLSQRWPGAMALAELFERVVGAGRMGDRAAERSRFFAEMIACSGQGLIELATCAPTAVRVSARPRASALSRHMLALGKDIVANLRHDAVQLDSGDRALVALLDGTRDRAALRDALGGARHDLEERLAHLAELALLEA